MEASPGEDAREYPVTCVGEVGDIRGKTIVIEGIDGSGKTTLSRAVAMRYSAHHTRYCSNKEIAAGEEYSAQPMRYLSNLLWPGKDTYFDHLLPVEYWLYLQVIWYTLFAEFTVKKYNNDQVNLIVDGWYHKFCAKLLQRGYNGELLSRVFAHIPEPSQVILLKPRVEDVWERGREFRPHEMGLHQGYKTLGRESFVEYQSEVQDHLVSIARRGGWTIIEISRLDTIEETIAKICRAIAPTVGFPIE